MKTIALIGTCDTKAQEMDYVREKLEARGISVLFLDVSTRQGYRSRAEFPPEQVFAAAGLTFEREAQRGKSEVLHAAAEGAAALVGQLYRTGRIQGAMSLGGLQNSNIGCHAMQVLPVGVPKVMVSTVACGQRVFEPLVGTKDVTILPAVSDFTGVNVLSEAVLSNAAAALAGMLIYAGRELQKSEKKVVGTTLMGITNDGVMDAAQRLKAAGYEVMSFHSTGAGGRAMEELVDSGIISAVMDLTLHEVVYEYFGYGFGYGANNRLEIPVKKGVPLLVCPGGIDFMCQWKWQLFDDIDRRIYNWHNDTLAHVKLRPKEAAEISNRIIGRLNQATGPVEVVIPTQGLRTLTRKGEALYDGAVDNAIFEAFQKNLRKDIPLKFYEANFCDEAFTKFVSAEMLRLMEEKHGTS